MSIPVNLPDSPSIFSAPDGQRIDAPTPESDETDTDVFLQVLKPGNGSLTFQFKGEDGIVRYSECLPFSTAPIIAEEE